MFDLFFTTQSVYEEVYEMSKNEKGFERGVDHRQESRNMN